MADYTVIPQQEDAPVELPEIGDTYHTAEGRRSSLARLWPTGYFYTRMMIRVWEAAHLSKKGRYGSRRFARGAWGFIHDIEAAGGHFSVTGMEHIRALERPAVFIGNHMSTLETFALAAFINPHRPSTYVIKQELLDYPLFRHVMRTRDPVTVTRKDPREDLKAVLQGGQARLEKGVSMIVFPQRTRSRDFNPEQFNSIGVKLAKRAGAPVVPLALKTDAWANGKLAKDFGPFMPERTIHFAFGQPMEITGNGQDQHQAIVDFIQSHLKAWS